MVKRYFLEISYIGSAYNGWQVQLNAPVTIQAAINEKLRTILQQDVMITGSSRTDTGVHARQNFAHVDLPEEIDGEEGKANIHEEPITQQYCNFFEFLNMLIKEDYYKKFVVIITNQNSVFYLNTNESKEFLNILQFYIDYYIEKFKK